MTDEERLEKTLKAKRQKRAKAREKTNARGVAPSRSADWYASGKDLEKLDPDKVMKGRRPEFTGQWQPPEWDEATTVDESTPRRPKGRPVTSSRNHRLLLQLEEGKGPLRAKEFADDAFRHRFPIRTGVGRAGIGAAKLAKRALGPGLGFAAGQLFPTEAQAPGRRDQSADMLAAESLGMPVDTPDPETMAGNAPQGDPLEQRKLWGLDLDDALYGLGIKDRPEREIVERVEGPGDATPISMDDYDTIRAQQVAFKRAGKELPSFAEILLSRRK